MIQAWISKSVQVGFAATLALAGVASAYDWCPSASDNTISCSNCNVSMTCSYGGTITITGNNVTLFGNSHWIFNSSGPGVDVRGGANIYDLNIYNASGTGFEFNNSSSTVKYSYLHNVYAVYSGQDGVDNLSGSGMGSGIGPSDVYINYSAFEFNSGTGIYAVHSAPGSRTWLYNSSIHGNYGYGSVSWHGNNISHANNYYTSNGWYGVFSSQANGGYYAGNNVNYNWSGIVINNAANHQATIVGDNTAIGNQYWDCWGQGAAHLTVYGNTWNNASGCYTK